MKLPVDRATVDRRAPLEEPLLKLYVIVVSTRPNRAGLPIATWFEEIARKSNTFEVELVDLAAVALPMMDEPAHPRLRTYQHQHTKDWSAKIDAADAFVFVTPEYNYSIPAPLVNALDYLFAEWGYKACGFVSYGGLSGGTRSVQMAKQIVTTLKMMPIPEAVNIAFFAQHMADGAFKGTDVHVQASNGMLKELHRWAAALKPMRTPPTV